MCLILFNNKKFASRSEAVGLKDRDIFTIFA